jgi:hypothetical protein
VRAGKGHNPIVRSILVRYEKQIEAFAKPDSKPDLREFANKQANLS